MTEYLLALRWFLIPLSLTILVESAVAWLLGRRDGRFYRAMLCINTVTNPLLCLFLLTLYRVGVTRQGEIVLFCEALIVLAEWQMLAAVFPDRSRRMLGLSLVLNGCSYLTGLFLWQWL